MEAVERCQKLAYEYGNQEIEEEHLLYSLLTIEDSLILKLIEKMGIPLKSLMSDIWIFPSIMLAIAFLFTDCFIAQRYEDVVAENTVLREGPHKNAIFQTLY